MNNHKIEYYQGSVSSKMMDLMLLADPSFEAIKGYLDQSIVLLAKHKLGHSADLLGIAVLSQQVESDIIECELKNIAVAPKHQGQGIAKCLIDAAWAHAKGLGAASMVVATGNSSLNQLALYQKCGFRIESVQPNYFASYPEPIIENGIACLDQIRLRRIV